MIFFMVLASLGNDGGNSGTQVRGGIDAAQAWGNTVMLCPGSWDLDDSIGLCFAYRTPCKRNVVERIIVYTKVNRIVSISLLRGQEYPPQVQLSR